MSAGQLRTANESSIAFIDEPTLDRLEPGILPLPYPVVVVCDGPLQTAVGLLGTHPWLCHVLSSTLLQLPVATTHLSNLVGTFEDGGKPRLLDRMREKFTGRRVELTQASRRAGRLEKMGDFFDSLGVGARTIQFLRDAAEELLTNAFYDAPVSAGAVANPISRTCDVTLPKETPCDMVYGCTDEFALIRVRDPFGALSRERMVEVLTRCARTDMAVEIDESMGGAGLGLWRIFAIATFVAVSVVEGHHTDVVVGISKKYPGKQRPYAFDLYFRPSDKKRRWQTMQHRPSEHTFTIVDDSDQEDANG